MTEPNGAERQPLIEQMDRKMPRASAHGENSSHSILDQCVAEVCADPEPQEEQSKRPSEPSDGKT